ncbi:MAG: dienelactone hydrolase family protein [Roseimicrobium sp.]
MKTHFFLIGCAVALSGFSKLHAEIKEGPVEYKAGDVVCEGWQAYDTEKEGKRPAVLIIHQWTGVSEYEKMRARMVAELGYNVMVADIYGKGVRPQPPEARKMAGKYKEDRALYRERISAALDVLFKDSRTDDTRVAVMGYCFGGTGALEAARTGASLRGVVSFHGGLGTPTPDDAKNIKGQVLVLHGADDPFVPAAEVEAFQKEMKGHGVKYWFVAYPGAVHSFTQKSAGNDNSKGSAYNADADEKSWKEMKDFFEKILK